MTAKLATAMMTLGGFVSLLAQPAALWAGGVFEIPAGTRFLVELRDKLDAKKIKPGKKFEARTLEALKSSSGELIRAGAKLKGRVNSVELNKLMLRFERIETERGKLPVVASVVGVLGEKDVRKNTGDEGEIQASRSRVKGAVTGAAIGGGIGAAVGATQSGKKGAAIGAGIGAVAGGVIGAAIGVRDLVLQKGTRLELELDRPLVFEPK